MAVITFAADATSLILNGFAFVSFAEGDTLELAPVNPLTAQTNGTNGAVAISKRSDGGVHNLKLRCLQGSDEDIFMNSASNQGIPTVFNGSIKENFVKNGVDGVDSWVLSNGSITDRPTTTKNTQEGNKMVEYTVLFRHCQRVL